jgi:hypothetical protein
MVLAGVRLAGRTQYVRGGIYTPPRECRVHDSRTLGIVRGWELPRARGIYVVRGRAQLNQYWLALSQLYLSGILGYEGGQGYLRAQGYSGPCPLRGTVVDAGLCGQVMRRGADHCREDCARLTRTWSAYFSSPFRLRRTKIPICCTN